MTKDLKIAISLITVSFFCSSPCRAEVDRIEPALGMGSSSLEMSVKTGSDDLIQYNTTNRGFYFVSVNYKRLSLMGKFPYKDRESERALRGDTKSSDYQFALELTPNYHLDLIYQKYQGYFVESKSKSLIDPDLSFDHRGAQVSYVFNAAYSASMVRDFYWNQRKSAGSWMVSLGYDYFKLEGDIAPPELASGLKSDLKNAKANTLALRGSYGYNWIWTNWFSGLAFGYGVNFNDIDYQYEKSQNKAQNRGTHTSFNLAGGYRWAASKVGLFSRSYSWGLDFDDKSLTSRTSTFGMYYSSVF